MSVTASIAVVRADDCAEYRSTHSWLLEYIHKTRSGEILVGRELRQQLDMLLAHFADPAIRVDLAPAHKRIRFIETQCRHSISPWAGKPFLLELWQKAFIEAIYGFKMYDPEAGTWLRRFTDVLLVIGRKNGKSSLCAALANAEFFCGPIGVNITCASNNFEQSAIVFDEINNMREGSRTLERVSRKTVSGVFMGNPRCPKVKGKFSRQNKAKIKKLSARSGAKEGRNVDFGIIDEVHEMQDNSLVMPVRQSMSTKVEPLLVEISTEGFVDGYLTERLKEARQVLAGELERPRWLIWLYTQDSEAEVWADERTWVRSNPGLGAIKRWAFLRGMVDEARTSMSTRAFVLAKDFNLRTAAAGQAWLPPQVVEREETFDVEYLRGAVALGGCDLSETTDLSCAHVLVMRPKDPVKYIVSHYWIPEEQIKRCSDVDRKRYQAWADNGCLTVVPGNENDHSLITAWFVRLYRERGIRIWKICMDRWGANYLARELEDIGFDTEKTAFEQASVSSPMKHAEKDLLAGLVNWNNHPVTRWCLGNTGVRVDGKEQILPFKLETNRRIDGAAALILCYYAYDKHRSEYLQALR